MMTQEMRRTALIREMLNETPAWQNTPMPQTPEEQKQLLRALFNIRPAKPASNKFIEIQDAYLQEEIANRGIVDAQTLPTVKKNDRIVLWQGDITRLKCGAIVNAANSALLGCFHPNHACIDNFIHTYAGVQLRLKCNEIMQTQGHKEPTGCAKITPGYNLPAQYVLHTVGPIVDSQVTDEHKRLLASCYRECLRVAAENGVKSVAFCCISTGVFHFPQELAASIATDTVTNFLNEHPDFERVIFNVFKDKDLLIYNELLN